MEINKCSFCGNKRDDDDIVVGLNAFICKDCIDVCKEEMLYNIEVKRTFFDKLKPHLIKEELDKYVIGQDEAKKILSVAVYNHYKKINIKSDINIQKSNILIQGPTGTGKTYLIEILAKLLDVPLVIVDATIFTEAGYVGKDVEFIIEKLLNASNGDIKKAETGIVYIDEIDKIAGANSNNTKSEPSREGVQQSLLKMLENNEVIVSIGDSIYKRDINVNTSNILFVAGGAFVGIEDIINKRNPKLKKTIGFQTKDSIHDVSENGTGEFFNEEMIHDDLVKYGLIPEFIGRFPAIISLKKLEKDDLKNILTKPKDATIKQYKALFKVDGIDLDFSDEAVDYIVEEAMKKKIGARGLKSTLEKHMYPIMYEAPQRDIKKLIITKDMLLKEKENLKGYI